MRFRRFAEPRTRRSEAVETHFAINNTKVAAREPHDVGAVVQLLQADRLGHERFTNEHLFAAPFDGALWAH